MLAIKIGALWLLVGTVVGLIVGKVIEYGQGAKRYIEEEL